MAEKSYSIYTDGACKGNPGRGSWAAIVINDENDRVVAEISGTSEMTTNNIMELTAVIRGLQAVSEPGRVTVYSDSAYIVNAFHQRWIDNWKRNGWRTKDKTSVKNRELWEELLSACGFHKVRFEKVKGHSGDHYNERVDYLANEALK
jgi:ribonuclease HI